MIKREISVGKKFQVKGKILKITEDGVIIQDKKNKDLVDTFNFDEFIPFIGRTVTVTITDTTKEEVMDLCDDTEEETLCEVEDINESSELEAENGDD